MDIEFSEEFIHDLADIMQYCSDNNVNDCELEFEVGEHTLVVDFTFSIK